MTPVLFGNAILIALTAWSIIDAQRTGRKFNALRKNCFITNEKGHRIRYVNATPEQRAKAEASN